MKIGDKVKVIRQGLVSTGWTGTIVSRAGLMACVKFDGRDRDLTYNIKSLELVKKPVEKQEDKFDIKEVNALTLEDKRQTYAFAFKNGKGEVKIIQATLSNESVDNDAQKLITGDFHIAFKDIIYLVKRNAILTFKRPEVNEFPFYVFDKDKVKLAFNRLEDIDTIAAGGYSMPIKWLEDINSIKPTFEKKQIRVLKQGVVLNQGEVFEQVADQLRKINNDDGNTKNSFGVIFRNKKTGKLTVWHKLNRPCHYYLQATNHDPATSHAEFAVQFMCKNLRSDDDNSLRREWLEYVMNDSPWSQYIITKSYDEALDTGILVRTDIPSNAMMCTFYALRYPTEYPAKIKAWKEYSDAGMDKAVAFFAAETGLFQKDTFSHHQLLNTYSMSLGALIKFANKEVGGKLTRKYTESLSYDNVSVHHGDDRRPDKTAVSAIREMNVFGGDKAAAGAFGGGGDRKVSLEKVIKVTNELLGKG